MLHDYFKLNILKNEILSIVLIIAQILFLLFLLIGRTVFIVHWLTDIIGGILISLTLLRYYYLTENIFISFQKNNLD